MPLESSSQVTPRTNANERRKMEIGQGTRYPVVSHGFYGSPKYRRMLREMLRLMLTVR